MKTIAALLALALAACSDPGGYTLPDAAPDIDAPPAPDPPPPPSTGCITMGNLPNSRTITLTDADPVPPDLINEMQDSIVAGARKQWKRPFYPVAIRTTTTGGGSLAGAANPANATYAPVCKIVGGQLSVYFEVPSEEGSRLVDFIVELYGDGTNDPGITIAAFNDMNSASIGGFVMNLTNVPAAWTTYTASVVGVGAPVIVPAGGFITGVLSVIDPNLHFGRMIAVYDRLP